MTDLAAALGDDLSAEIATRNRITAEDVLRLRQGTFRDGVVDLAEAEAVFRLDQACAEKDADWTSFYVEALTDYFVWKSDPSKYVSETQAAFLIDRIVHDGRIDSATELELLINIAHWAESCPDSLVELVLEAVRDSVLDPDHAAYGRGRRAKVIDATDVAILRKVLYAGSGNGGFTISQGEAELIFALNRACDETANAPDWQRLFVQTVANYMMFPRGAPTVPDATERRRRDAWLKDRRGVGRLLRDVGQAVLDLGFVDELRESDPFGRGRAATTAAGEQARRDEATQREAITAAEAGWLLALIDEDGEISANERALLAFVRQNATAIDPLLEPLLTRAGL